MGNLTPEAQKRVERLREYLRTAPQEELDARWARVQAKNLPNSPTLSELLGINKQ